MSGAIIDFVNYTVHRTKNSMPVGCEVSRRIWKGICFLQVRRTRKNMSKRRRGASRKLFSKGEIKRKSALWREESVGIFNIITSSRDAHGRY